MNQRIAAVYIRERLPFRAGNLSAANATPNRAGVMKSPWVDEYLSRVDRNEIVYVVYSYATPIAWLDTDGVWTLPAITYSRTTSKHQGITRRAIQEG